ncbi:MAG: ribosome small subunit-dependent GTPase A [Spirochaetaceae bacterium]|jgi:ribosome biogenesis GTPase|nr:ribosome small subunit-dependent GTPase A [Spirochaetaceae bacterium]
MGNEYDLAKYGANEYFYNEALFYPGLQMARVVLQHKELYKIAAVNGESFAEVSGKFRHEVKNISEYPVTGDFIMISHDNTQDGNAIIHNILPRKTVFKRLSAGNNNQEQIIAANIDIIFVCVSLNSNYNLNRIERYLSAAWNSGARPIVILTKSDLCNDLENKINEVSSIAPGVDVISTSRDNNTCEKIIQHLKIGITASFIGSSGVGKSTLINRLAGKELLETQDIQHNDKGRHTTTRRELILLPNGGIVIDTPGMREFGVESVDLSKTFFDIDELAAQCKFGNCTHVSEPGCAVQKALAYGGLGKRRFENYQKLKKEALYDGLSSKQIETIKLEAMFKEIGGMKNMRNYIREKMKNKYKS